MDFNIICTICKISKIAGICFYKTDDIYSNICVKCKPKKVWRPYIITGGIYKYKKPIPKIKGFYKLPHKTRVNIKTDIKNGYLYTEISKKYNINYYSLLRYKDKGQLTFKTTG